MRDFVSQLYLRCAPSVAAFGEASIVSKCLHRLSSRLLPRDRLTWVQICTGEAQGLWIAVKPRTGRIFYEGSCEPEVQRLLGQRLSPGMVFYDLGANIGFFSMLAARRIGPGGKVFAFEPEPELVKRIRGNADRNHLVNVVVVDAAVWSKTGLVAFEPSDPANSPDRGTGQVATSTARRKGARVRSIALDDFAETAPAPNLIKCDVEFAELEAMRGAKNVLALHKPTVVCEIHSRENEALLGGFLAQFGYSVTQLDGSHVVAEVRR